MEMCRAVKIYMVCLKQRSLMHSNKMMEYTALCSLDDLRHIQQRGIYGAGISLEFTSDKAGDDVDSELEFHENDSYISDQIAPNHSTWRLRSSQQQFPTF